MKIKLFLSLLLAGGLMASAQTQGYKDGIEYYKAGQYDNARTILERTLNDANTDKALILGRLHSPRATRLLHSLSSTKVWLSTPRMVSTM